MKARDEITAAAHLPSSRFPPVAQKRESIEMRLKKKKKEVGEAQQHVAVESRHLSFISTLSGLESLLLLHSSELP